MVSYAYEVDVACPQLGLTAESDKIAILRSVCLILQETVVKIKGLNGREFSQELHTLAVLFVSLI
jgi:hypothetical protein